MSKHTNDMSVTVSLSFSKTRITIKAAGVIDGMNIHCYACVLDCFVLY